jgi:hypothetical protein
MLPRIAIIVGALSFAGIMVMPVVQQRHGFELAAATRSRWESGLEEGRRASLQELAKKEHLSSVQVEVLDDLLSAEQEKMLEVFRRVREDGLPMPDARAQVEVIRLATDREVDTELDLDDDQLSSYEQMRPVYRVGGPPPGGP